MVKIRNNKVNIVELSTSLFIMNDNILVSVEILSENLIFVDLKLHCG